MTKLSKGFYLGSILISFILMIGFLIAEIIELADNQPENAMIFVGLIWLILIYIVVVMSRLVYKMWAAIQDGHARTTPGKALGFCFIPFFNFYWVFQAFPGFARDYNTLVDRYSLRIPKLPVGLFMAYAVLCLLALIPLLGILAALANLVVTMMMIAKICDGVNALPAVFETTGAKQVERDGLPENHIFRKKGIVCAVIAAFFPLLFSFTGLIVLLSLLGADTIFRRWDIEQFGPFLFLIVGMTIIAVLASSVLLLLEGLGKRIVVVILIGCCLLPWGAGMWCFRTGIRNIAVVIEQMGVPMGSGAIVAGHAEATFPLVLGSFLSGILLAAAGLGLSLSSVGRATNPRWAMGLALGAGTSLPLIVFVVVMMLQNIIGWAMGSMLLSIALGVAIVSGLAGAGGGQDPPHERSTCLAAAAPVAMGLCFFILATSAYLWVMVHWLNTVGMMGLDVLNQMENGMFSTLEALAMVRWAGGLLALLPIGFLAAWTYSRSRSAQHRILGAGMLAVLVLLTVGMEIMMENPNRELLATIAQEAEQLPEQPAVLEDPPESAAAEKDSQAADIIQIPPPARKATIPSPTSTSPSPEFEDIVEAPEHIPPLPPVETTTGKEGLGLGEPPVAKPGDPLHVGGGVNAPKLISSRQPEYPEIARRARVQGVVILEAVIDDKGNVTYITMLSGHPLLWESAVTAVRDWKFEPATLHGKPVAVRYTLSVRFQLN